MVRASPAANPRIALPPAASGRAFHLDFYCPRKKLCIELDGGIHDAQQERDAQRTEALERLKIRVVRFRNEEVLNDLASVIQRIEAEAGPE